MSEGCWSSIVIFCFSAILGLITWLLGGPKWACFMTITLAYLIQRFGTPGE